MDFYFNTIEYITILIKKIAIIVDLYRSKKIYNPSIENANVKIINKKHIANNHAIDKKRT